MINRWPIRHGTALGIAVLVLLTLTVGIVMQSAANRNLPVGFSGAGEHTFGDFCGECHGWYGDGTADGPAIVGSEATALESATIERSIRDGSGEMPAIRSLENQDIADIIAFLRDVQRGGY